ncbi:MAG TPA: hypothetical protein VJT14_15300 [Candidatus Dormibacteraeota bacterium]|nr:hypothetical protein [Candidatus Dormibacteraeota bacterium]
MRHWKAWITFAAVVAVAVPATLYGYGRLAPGAPASPSPSLVFTPESVVPSPAPLATMASQAWIPDWASVSGGVYAVPPNYGRTFPAGFGPPHAASLTELGRQPGCDPASSAPDPYGPCGWGAFVRCVDNPWTPACNQRLSNGMTCGFGLQDCIEAQLTCRLPITGGLTIGGFVSFPEEVFTPDPSSNNIRMRWPFHYSAGPSYDRVYARWLPTSMALTSPDGTHYAYFGQDWAVHDVGVLDGSDHVVGPPGEWFPLAYADAGIYAAPFTQENGQGAGLWLLLQNRSKRISRSGYWSIVGGGAAYGHPTQNPILSFNQLVRLDLITGTSTPWFRRPQQYLQVIGFDGAGHPIVLATGGQEAGIPYPGYRELWLITGQNAGVKLISGVLDFIPQSMSDKHGIWLWGSDGLDLLTVVTDSAGVAHPVFARVASPRALHAVGTCA